MNELIKKIFDKNAHVYAGENDEMNIDYDSFQKIFTDENELLNLIIHTYKYCSLHETGFECTCTTEDAKIILQKYYD
jgi:hypothetical protein